MEGTAKTLPCRFEELMIALYERGFLEVENVYMTKRWIMALNRAGYQFLDLIDTQSKKDWRMILKEQIRIFLSSFIL